MYCLIFQPEDMIKLCLHFNESWPIYAYKRYAYKIKSAEIRNITKLRTL